MNNLFYQYSNSTIDPELLFYLLSDKLEVDYQLIIKNIIPKIANPSQIATILKFFELIFPFLCKRQILRLPLNLTPLL